MTTATSTLGHVPAALQAHLDLPFYDDGHRALAQSLWAWAQALPPVDHEDTDHACRQLVRQLGAAGFLRYCVPAAYGGALPVLDSRSLCLIREILGWHDGLADFAFAMQGWARAPFLWLAVKNTSSTSCLAWHAANGSPLLR